MKQQQKNIPVDLITFDELVAPPTQPASPLSGNSEPHPRGAAMPVTADKPASKEPPKRPPPPSPYQIFTNPRTHVLGRNPWQVGAALIDSTVHQLDKRFGKPSGMYASRPSAPQKTNSQRNTEVNPQKAEITKKTATAGNDSDDDDFQVQLLLILYLCPYQIPLVTYM